MISVPVRTAAMNLDSDVDGVTTVTHKTESMFGAFGLFIE